jgi:WD40 repeat protein
MPVLAPTATLTPTATLPPTATATTFPTSTALPTATENVVYSYSLLGEKNTGSATVYSVAFKPNTNVLFVGTGSGLWRWDIDNDTFNAVQTSEEIYQIVFSQAGDQAATYGSDNIHRLWKVDSNGQLISAGQVFEEDNYTDMAFSPDGRFLATASLGMGVVRIWDTNTLDLVYKSPQVESGLITGIAFSPDGRYLAAGTAGEGYIQVFDTSNWTLVNRIQCWSESLKVAPDGKLIAQGAEKISVYKDVPSGQLLFSVRNTNYTVGAWKPGIVVVAPDGGMFVTPSKDGIRFWHVNDGTLLFTLEQNGVWPYEEIGDMTFNQNMRLFAVGLKNGLIQIWGIP